MRWIFAPRGVYKARFRGYFYREMGQFLNGGGVRVENENEDEDEGAF